MSDEIATVVQTAVTAINEATRVMGKTDSQIDDAQISELWTAVDQLESRLYEKKRALDSDGW
jgi:hypothetical protein